MADDVSDRYIITLGMDASSHEVEAANARANNREPRPFADEAPAAEEIAPPQPVDESADDVSEDAREEPDTARPRETRRDRRIQQLVAERNTERDGRLQEREARIRAEERLAVLEQRLAPEPEIPKPPPSPPDRDDFEDEDEYLDARSTWNADQRITERETQRQEAEAAAAEEAALREAARQEGDAVRRAAARHDLSPTEFVETLRVAETPRPVLNNALNELFVDLDVKADILYHLATNPDTLATLNQQEDPLGVARRLVELERTLRPPEPASTDAEPNSALESPPPEPPPQRNLPPLSGNAEPGAGEYDPYRDGIPDHETYVRWIEKQTGRRRWR